jgi:hypothetical protein
MFAAGAGWSKAGWLGVITEGQPRCGLACAGAASASLDESPALADTSALN